MSIPRRNDIQQNTPGELAIRAAIEAVEKEGAHPHLTAAVILLGDARERVADFVDNVEVPLATYQPEMRTLEKDAIYAAVDALRIGLENTQELLSTRDTELGRTTRSNRLNAERMEQEIKKMEAAIKALNPAS